MTTIPAYDAFTDVAPSYDATFTDIRKVRDLRHRVQALMADAWAPGMSVLDIGCGTGEDALFLARRGCSVVAIDPALGMVEQARRKLALSSVSADVRRMSAEDLTSFSSASFDGILSNFAALNHLSDLRDVLAECARLLVPDGVLILCLFNRFCLWEVLSFLARGDVDNAFRRWHENPVPILVGTTVVPVFYHSARRVRASAMPWFEIKSMIGLSVFSPMPSSLRFVDRHPKLAHRLSLLDRMLSPLPGFRALGDHYVLVLRRRKERA